MVLLLLDILGAIWLIACVAVSYLLFRFMESATRGFILALLDAKDEIDD